MTRERLSANSRNYIPKKKKTTNVHKGKTIYNQTWQYFIALAKSLGKLHILYLEQS
jgi:hypothetical protein